MVEGDIPNVIRILQDHVAQFTIAPIIDEAYIRRWVLPIHSYVDDSSGAFVSFYDIPYERVDGSGTIKQAVRFYTVGKDVFNDTFILAKNLGSDVFNTLDVGVTGNLRDYKFMEGSGYIHYHLFNYTVTSDKPVTIQMVLP
jgi:glycylpeptide N-tetradecanoyltransferase